MSIKLTRSAKSNSEGTQTQSCTHLRVFDSFDSEPIVEGKSERPNLDDHTPLSYCFSIYNKAWTSKIQHRKLPSMQSSFVPRSRSERCQHQTWWPFRLSVLIVDDGGFKEGYAEGVSWQGRSWDRGTTLERERLLPRSSSWSWALQHVARSPRRQQSCALAPCLKNIKNISVRVEELCIQLQLIQSLTFYQICRRMFRLNGGFEFISGVTCYAE